MIFLLSLSESRIYRCFIAFRFNLFSAPQDHRVFNYRPVYYDPEKERFKERLKKVSAERDIKALEEGKPHKADKDYVPGSIIQGSLRDGAYYPTKSEGGTLVRLAKYAMYIVLGIFLYVFAKYFAYMFL